MIDLNRLYGVHHLLDTVRKNNRRIALIEIPEAKKVGDETRDSFERWFSAECVLHGRKLSVQELQEMRRMLGYSNPELNSCWEGFRAGFNIGLSAGRED